MNKAIFVPFFEISWSQAPIPPGQCLPIQYHAQHHHFPNIPTTSTYFHPLKAHPRGFGGRKPALHVIWALGQYGFEHQGHGSMPVRPQANTLFGPFPSPQLAPMS